MLSTLVSPNWSVNPIAPIAISAPVTTPNPIAWTASSAMPYAPLAIERLYRGLADRADHHGRRVGRELLHRLRAERVVVGVEHDRPGRADVLDLVSCGQRR